MNYWYESKIVHFCTSMFLRSIWWEGTFSLVEPLLNWMYRMLLVSSCSEINTVKSTHFFTVFSPFTISTDKNFVGSPVWSLSRIKLCYFYMYNIAESFCDRPIFAKLCCWKKKVFILIAQAYFSYPAAVTIAGGRAANFDRYRLSTSGFKLWEL